MKNLSLVFVLALACVTAPKMPETPKGPNGIDQPKKEQQNGTR